MHRPITRRETEDMRLLPIWLRNLAKQSKAIAGLYGNVSWKIHLFKDWWGTRVWKRTTEVVTPSGLKLITGFHPAYQLMREGKFEVEETALITRLLGQIDVFVDIGANLGYYTCLALQHGKQVVAVEPQQQNLQCLYQNIMVNGYEEQAEVFPLALSAKPGLLTLFGASGPSASLIKGWAGYSSTHKQTVPASTLDNILGVRFAGMQLFIKVDVEGAEYQVLEGARATMARTRKPIWLLEIFFQRFHPSGANPDFHRIFELFWENGYHAYTATEFPRLVTPQEISNQSHNKSSDHSTFNYLFAAGNIKIVH